MSTYPLIADHGPIGTSRRQRLSPPTEQTIDWFCPPRFDDPDHSLDISCYDPEAPFSSSRFLTDSGVGEVVDFVLVASAAIPTDGTRSCGSSAAPGEK
jgi:hypothetical protein